MSKKIMAWANGDVKEWDRLMILNRNQGMHIPLREMQMIALKFTLWAMHNLTNLSLNIQVYNNN